MGTCSSHLVPPWFLFSLLSLEVCRVALLSEPRGGMDSKDEVFREFPPHLHIWGGIQKTFRSSFLGRSYLRKYGSVLLPLNSSPLPLWHQQDFVSSLLLVVGCVQPRALTHKLLCESGTRLLSLGLPTADPPPRTHPHNLCIRSSPTSGAGPAHGWQPKPRGSSSPSARCGTQQWYGVLPVSIGKGNLNDHHSPPRWEIS